MHSEAKQAAMSSLHQEKLVDYGTARRMYIPSRRNGKSVAPSTFQRWVSKGINGVRLEVVYCGARPMTSVEAIQRFFRDVTAARLEKLRQAATPEMLTASDAELEAAGLLS